MTGKFLRQYLRAVRRTEGASFTVTRPLVEGRHVCEICGGTDVRRDGDWDYCAIGHTYVGKRVER